MRAYCSEQRERSPPPLAEFLWEGPQGYSPAIDPPPEQPWRVAADVAYNAACYSRRLIMGHRITYAIRKEGTLSLFSSRWGALSAPADMFWGASSTDAFIRSNQPTEEWYDTCWGEGGIALDYDSHTVAFFGGEDDEVEAVRRLYERLAGVLWGPAWAIRWVEDMRDVAVQVGVDPDLVTSRPMACEVDRLGMNFVHGMHQGLVHVRNHGGEQDWVFDQNGLGLLMLGPDALQYFATAKTLVDFLAYFKALPKSECAGGQRRFPVVFRDYLQLDLLAQTIHIRLAHPEGHDHGFLERLYSQYWPGWTIVVLKGGVDEHFASLGRDVPEELMVPQPEPKNQATELRPMWDQQEPQPATFEECVAVIASFLFGNETLKTKMADMMRRIATKTEADSVGPVVWGKGFFAAIPASGPEEVEKKRRFEAAVRWVQKNKSWPTP